METSSGALPKTPTPALTDKALRMSYHIARGEQGVLTFEPYKSHLLPHWRFATPAAARESSQALGAFFRDYEEAKDFVGMDMTRKFIQMGVTRARRYANYKGGRKYNKKTGAQNEKGKDFAGRDDKMQASEIFRRMLEQVKASKVYDSCRKSFLREQAAWEQSDNTDAVPGSARQPLRYS